MNTLDTALRNYDFADAGPGTRPASSSGRSAEERGVDCTQGSYFQTFLCLAFHFYSCCCSHDFFLLLYSPYIFLVNVLLGTLSDHILISICRS